MFFSAKQRKYFSSEMALEETLLGPTEIRIQNYDSVSKYQKTLKYHLSDMLPTRPVAQSVEHWTSKPKDVGSSFLYLYGSSLGVVAPIIMYTTFLDIKVKMGRNPIPRRVGSIRPVPG